MDCPGLGVAQLFFLNKHLHKTYVKLVTLVCSTTGSWSFGPDPGKPAEVHSYRN